MIMTQVRLTPKYGSLKAACVTSVVTPVKFQSAPHEHKAKLSHELIAGAAAYEVWLHLIFFFDVLTNIPQAAKAYQAHCAKHGKPPSHEKAKEILYILVFCVCWKDLYSPSIQCRLGWCRPRQDDRNARCKCSL